MGKIIVTITSISVLLVGSFFVFSSKEVSAQTSSDWYMAGANSQRTSWVPEEAAGNLTPEWFTYIPSYKAQKIQPIITNDTVYISASDGLYAVGTNPSNVNPTTYEATSNIKWHYPTAMPLGHSPTVINGIAYVGGMDKKVHAVRDNGSSYTVLWTSPEAGAGFETNPVVANNLVYVANRDGKLYAYNINNGQLAWSFATGGPIQQSPAYKNNVLYIVSNDMYGYAVNATTGQQIWRSQAADSTTGKFPGDGFPTYWPVVTSQRSPATGQMKDYVIFSRMEIWGNVNDEESTDIYGTTRNQRVTGRLVGPTGTVAAGETWAPVGTQTIDASSTGEYLANKPWRRVYFLIDAATGQEVKFDFDGDGDMEYMPLTHTGSDHGIHYPPIVGGNGTLYQRANYIEGNIPRGGLVGWKFGTGLISQVGLQTWAVDEPTSHSAGGNILFGKLTSEGIGTAANYSVLSPQNLSYFNYTLPLAARIPALFDKGWPFAHWKQGSQSPFVPYKGKVYAFINNGVVAFGTQGAPMGPAFDIGITTGQSATALEKSDTIHGVYTNVTADNTSWPLLFQQENYFVRGSLASRAFYFPVFSIEGSTTINPTAVNRSTVANAAQSLTSTFSGGTLSVRVTDRSPTILAENTSNQYHLRGSLDGIAFRTASGIRVVRTDETISGSDLTAGWILVWDTTDTHRWFPMVLSLEKRPTQISFSTTGITFTYPSSAGYLSVVPYNGMSDPLPGKTLPYTSERSNSELTQWRQSIPSGVVTKAEQLARRAQSIPSSWTETTTINASNDAVRAINYSEFIEFTNAWNQTPERLAYIPPQIALADWGSSPIQISGSITDWNYPVPLGRIAGIQNTSSVTVTLPTLAQFWETFEQDEPTLSSDDPVQQKLASEVQKMVAAGHLRPGYIPHHQLGIQGRRHGEYLYEYFHNPGDTIYTLLKTLPYLDAATRAQVRSYIQTEYTNYNPATIVHVGYNPPETVGQQNSARREYGDAYPEFENALPVGNSTSEVNWAPAVTGWTYTPSNIYALYLYAKEFGNASSIFQSVRTKLEDPFSSDSFKISMPTILNNYITGHIGYLRLAQLAGVTGDTQVQAAEQRLVDLFIMRSALSKNPESLKQTGFEYKDYNWTIKSYRPGLGEIVFDRVIIGTIWTQYDIYGEQSNRTSRRSFSSTSGTYAFTIDFMHVIPELGAFMNTYAVNDVAKQVEAYEKASPYWFVSKMEESGGEVSIQPIHDTIALFNAKAYALNEPRQNLEKYIDVPTFARGDLYFIQKLTAVLAADGQSSITPPPSTAPSPTPVLGDVNGDGNVTIADLSILLANFGGTGKTRGQGDVSGNDGNVTIADLSTLLSNFGN